MDHGFCGQGVGQLPAQAPAGGRRPAEEDPAVGTRAQGHGRHQEAGQRTRQESQPAQPQAARLQGALWRQTRAQCREHHLHHRGR